MVGRLRPLVLLPAKGCKWDFFGYVTDHNGQTGQVTLFQAAKVPIKRHIKTMAIANPFDPDWELYFEQRLTHKMRDQLKGKRHTLTLWQAQQGLCPICQQFITEVTGWHIHHIIWRVYGGDDSLQNTVLLHPTCHNQVHGQHITVIKPRPSPDVPKT
jgi:RNA-directed DNA polymerase